MPQHKPSKLKLAAFVAGATRHECFFTDLGDYLTMVHRRAHQDGDVSWLIPELQDTGSPGSKLGAWMKV